MLLKSDQINEFSDIFDIGEIVRVDNKRFVADVTTETGRHLRSVPFIYNYLFSGFVMSKDETIQYVGGGDNATIPRSLPYVEGQGILYMPEVGARVLILYIKNLPYIYGFFLPNTAKEDNSFNKAEMVEGELRFQARDGAYLHIRRNAQLDLFATPLARMILTSLENTMKLFLENAFMYFNVGHIFFSTDYDDGSTDYEIWLRPNMSTKKNYLKMTVGSKPNLARVQVARTQNKDYKNEDNEDEIPVWDLKIREDGNTNLQISTNPTDKNMQSKLEWDLGVDNKYDFKLSTGGETKIHINMTEDGDINIEVKGNTTFEVDGNLTGEIHKSMNITADNASSIHCKSDMTVKADGALTLQGNPIYEN